MIMITIRNTILPVQNYARCCDNRTFFARAIFSRPGRILLLSFTMQIALRLVLSPYDSGEIN